MSHLDDVLADIQQRVERRRAAGDYPPELEQRLAAHAARNATSTGGGSAALDGALEDLHQASRFNPDAIPTSSRSRAGEAAHRALNLALARQTGGILAQVGAFAERVEQVLRLVVERLETQHPPVLLAAQLDAVLDRLTQLDQPLDQAAALADLRQRIEALEASGRVPQGAAWWDTRGWVDNLDGSFEQVVALRDALAAQLAGPVLDVSCRRGELLWALRDRGTEARGAEADSRLAATAAGAGLAVVHAGPLLTLARAEDASLGSVVALGVAGRLGAQGATDLVGLAADKLRFGGRLLIELADLDGPAPFADPLAGAPLPAEWIRFACTQVRFSAVNVERAAAAPAGVRAGCYLVTATK